MRLISYSLSALAVGIAILLTLWLLQETPPAQEAPAIPVLAATPVVKDVPIFAESVGSLHPAIFRKFALRSMEPLLQT